MGCLLLSSSTRMESLSPNFKTALSVNNHTLLPPQQRLPIFFEVARLFPHMLLALHPQPLEHEHLSLGPLYEAAEV